MIKYSSLISLIVFGSTTHATVQLKNARDKGSKFSIYDFGIAMFIAGFSGTVFGLVGTALGLEGVSLYICVSVGSFLGLTGINKLADVLLTAAFSKVKK